jgi:hypothetical protein
MLKYSGHPAPCAKQGDFVGRRCRTGSPSAFEVRAEHAEHRVEVNELGLQPRDLFLELPISNRISARLATRAFAVTVWSSWFAVMSPFPMPVARPRSALGWTSAAEMIHFHCVPLATRRLSSRENITTTPTPVEVIKRSSAGQGEPDAARHETA